ncbi:MAG: NAD(P)/FAD-dependent oxidoreductase, partial [Eubacteriales bacterium]
LFEKNEKLGKKIFITGKGRCNVTNACDVEDLFKNMVSNEKFMYSSFYTFDNQALMEFFKELDCPLKIERGNRVFPVSDHSSDIIRALTKALKDNHVTVHLNSEVKKILEKDGQATGIVLKGNGKEYKADAVIIATGGISYGATGSTGDGHRMASELGHSVKKMQPALVPFVIKETWCHELQGLALKNVSLTVKNGKKEIYSGFGEFLFTHFGISGPLVISASSYYAKKAVGQEVRAILDLKPALSVEQLDRRILRDFEANQNKQFKNAIDGLFPARLVPVMIALSGINPEKKVNEISKEERQHFVQLIKHVELTITGTRDFKEAIITQGGIATKEVNPSTMESKKIAGLYIVGELLDLDALTGGFNLQIAWSTGYLAGINAGKEVID